MRALCLLFSLSVLQAFGSVTLLDPQKVEMVSYVLAANKGIGKSSFGHAYLRFSEGDEVSASDLMVEFVADVEDGQIDYLRGMGVGENYDLVVNASNYKSFSIYHTQQENRNLTTYTLDLSREQIESVVNAVNRMITEGVGRDYAFFSTNCATIVSYILNGVIEKDLKGLRAITPSLIPGELKKRNLVVDEIEDPRISKKRKQIAESSELRFLGSQPWTENLTDQLSSSLLRDRVFAYRKINIVRSHLTRKENRILTGHVLKLLGLEPVAVKDFFYPIFIDPNQSFNIVSASDHIGGYSSQAKVSNVKIVTKSGDVFVEVTVKSKRPIGKDNRGINRYRVDKALVPVGELHYHDGVIRNNMGDPLWYKLDRKISQSEFFSKDTDVNAELVNTPDGIKLRVYMLRNNRAISTEQKVDKNSMLAIINDGHLGYGVCLSHTELTDLLSSKAVYMPEFEKPSQEQSLPIITDLLNGKITLIPGFSNAMDFTKSIDPDLLMGALGKRQVEAHSFGDRFLDYFGELKINADNFYVIKNLLALGVKPKVFFKPEGKNLGHSILIVNVDIEGEYAFIEAIDPNFGLVKNHFKFNLSSSRLETSFYGHTAMNLLSINVPMRLEEIRLTQSEKSIERMKRVFKTNGNTSFSLSSFY